MALNLPQEPFEVEITGLSAHGEGIARYDNKGIFVSGALPDEKCRIKIVHRYRRMARAEIIELLQPSPQRINPPCPHYPVSPNIRAYSNTPLPDPPPAAGCGGCQLQHLSYQEQLAYKLQTVSDALRHIGSVKVQPNPIIAGSPWSYRNKMTFPFTVENGRIAVGLHPRDSYKQIVPIRNCMIIEEPLQQILPLTVQALNQSFRSEDIFDAQKNSGILRYLIFRSFCGIPAVGLVIREKNNAKLEQFKQSLTQIPAIKTAFIHLSPDPNDYLWTEDKTEILFGDNQFSIKAANIQGLAGVSTFLQVNSQVSEKLYEYALNLPVQGNDVVIDTYCGIGLLTLALSKKFQQVIGIDFDNAAIRFAQQTADKQGITNAEFIAGPAEHVFRVWKKEGHFQMPEFLERSLIQRLLDLGNRIDSVILDPPRSGIHPKVIKRLGEILPKDIILISCHPATLARDLKSILPFDYQVSSVQPFDMFPQTFHIETVVHLQKSGI